LLSGADFLSQFAEDGVELKFKAMLSGCWCVGSLMSWDRVSKEEWTCKLEGGKMMFLVTFKILYGVEYFLHNIVSKPYTT